MFLKLNIKHTKLFFVKKKTKTAVSCFFEYQGIDICLVNASVLQVRFLFLAWSREGGTYSKRSGGMEGKKNEWEQMIH